MKSTKKILGASAALGLAVALSAGSTFAWFVTAGRTTTKVSNITMTVQSSAGGGEVLNVIIPTLSNSSTASSGEFKASADASSLTVPTMKPLTLKSTTSGEWVLKSEEHQADSPITATEDEGYLEFTIGFQSSVPMLIYLDQTEEKTDTADNNKVILEENMSSVLPKNTAPKTETWDLRKGGTDFTQCLVEGDSITGEGASQVVNTWKASSYYTDITGAIVLQTSTGDEVKGTSYDNLQGTVDLNARAANAARLSFEEVAVERPSTDADPYTPLRRVWAPNEALYSGAEFESTDTVENNAQGFYQNNLARDYRALKSQLNNGDTEFALPSAEGNALQQDYSAYGALVPYIATATKGTDKWETKDNVGASTNPATPIATLQQKSKLNGAGDILINGSTTTPYDYLTDSDGYYAFVNVKVWLEGTDGDCFDSILGDKFSVNLAFKGVKKGS